MKGNKKIGLAQANQKIKVNGSFQGSLQQASPSMMKQLKKGRPSSASNARASHGNIGGGRIKILMGTAGQGTGGGGGTYFSGNIP